MEEHYLDYEYTKARYEAMQERFAKVLLEKERLFLQAIPGAIRYDKDKISSTPIGSPLEDFVVNVDTKELDIKISRLRRHLNDWGALLSIKENTLRKSTSLTDRVYVMRYLDGYGVNRMCRQLHYAKSRIYQILQGIENNLKCGKNRKNYML